MKENEVYSIHSKNSSDPHKVGNDKPISQVQQSPVQPAAPEPYLKPIPKPQSITPVQPVEMKMPELPPQQPVVSEDQQNKVDQQQAIAIARSKIEAIHGGQALEPEPNQAPPIAQGYETEQIIQTELDPNSIPAQPDHQLPPAPTSTRQQYGQYALPGAQQPQEYQPQQTAPAPAPIQAKRKASQAVKEKLQKIDTKGIKEKAKSHIAKAKKITRKVKQTHEETLDSGSHKKSMWRRLAPAVSLVLIVTLILNNQLVYGQISYYVTPGNRIETPTIIESEAGNQAPEGERIVIPKINVDVPINNKVETYDEESIQNGLEDGIVHYANTGMPGEVGNNVLLGHNTNNFWNSGKYKTAFVLLDRLKNGDTFEIHHNSTRYVYEVYEKKIIEADDFSVVNQKVTEPIVTLITCHPPGTSWKRLIIQARQISPEPSRSDTTQGNDVPEAVEGNVPGAAPGPLEDIFNSLF